MPPITGPGNFGVPRTSGVTEFARFRSSAPIQNTVGDDVHRAPTIQLPAKPDRNASALTWLWSTILPLMASVALSAISPAWATQPVSIPKPIYFNHEVTSPNLVLKGTIPFVKNDWPNPSLPPRASHPVTGWNAELVQAASITTPFTQLAWPNPALPKPYPIPQSVRSIRSIVSEPFTQLDWPNPSRPPGPFSEVRGPNLPLQFVAAAGNPFVQTSWPNPTLPKPLPAPSSVRPVFTSEFQPFYQTQWPNPTKPPGPFSEVRGLNLSLLPAQNAPFTQLAWPNPTLPKPYPIPQSVRSIRSIVSEPFTQLDWPNPTKPIIPAPPSIYRPQADQASAVDRPFVQTDWPNPIPPPRIRMPQPEQYFEAVYKPVMQNDWPLPWYPPPFKHDVIGPNLAVLHDMTNVPRPFVQQNWPLPWLPFPPKQWVIGAQDPLIPLPPEIPRPFTQWDWPLPKLPPVYVHPVGPWPIVILTSPDIPVIPPATINYQGDGKKRKKRKNETYELFAKIESTIRTSIAGPVTVEALAHPQIGEPSVDLSLGYGHALDRLLETAGEYQELSRRVQRLQAEITAYEQRKQRERDEDDDEWQYLS